MSREHRTRAKPAWWQEVLFLVVLALAVSVLVKAFVAQMFFVPSTSMLPQLEKDDRILVEKVSLWRGEVERGDVVVFRDPGGWLPPGPELEGLPRVLSLVGLYPTGGHLVKRVVGVGGDEVACCDARGRVTVNGDPLEESAYLRDGVRPSQREFDVVVPEDSLWMMGDNRSNSEDSRFHMQEAGDGSVPVDAVVGKVWAVVWPADRWQRLEPPETFASVGDSAR